MNLLEKFKIRQPKAQSEAVMSLNGMVSSIQKHFKGLIAVAIVYTSQPGCIAPYPNQQFIEDGGTDTVTMDSGHISGELESDSENDQSIPVRDAGIDGGEEDMEVSDSETIVDAEFDAAVELDAAPDMELTDSEPVIDTALDMQTPDSESVEFDLIDCHVTCRIGNGEEATLQMCGIYDEIPVNLCQATFGPEGFESNISYPQDGEREVLSLAFTEGCMGQLEVCSTTLGDEYCNIVNNSALAFAPMQGTDMNIQMGCTE